MDFNFLQTHIDTLSQLEAIAKRHGCHISFSTTAEADADIFDILDIIEISEEAHAFLEDHLPDSTVGAFSAIKFWLVDDLTGTDSFYEYAEYDVKGYLDEEDWAEASDDVTNELESDYQDGYFQIRRTKETVSGFDGSAAQGGCYRPDMALKYFGDMVCDKLNEPKIVAAY